MLDELDYFQEDEITCSNCGKDFDYERNVQVTYTSNPIE